MRRLTTMTGLMLVTLVMLSCFGCKGKELRQPIPTQMPGWCLRASGVVDDTERGKLVIGIGRVEGIKSPEMALVNVDGQARKQIATVFGVYTEKLLAGYRGFTDEDGKKTSDYELQATKTTLSKMNLRTGEIADRFTDTENNVWYALGVLPYGSFASAVSKNAELSVRFRQYAQGAHEAVFSELPRHDKP